MKFKFENINSVLFDSNSDTLFRLSIYHLEQRLEQLNQSFWRSPIYLVDKTLMDLISPPEKRMGININSLNSCNFYEGFQFPEQEYYRSSAIVGLGVYCSLFNHQDFIRMIDEKYTAIANYFRYSFKSISDPCIFVCPERILGNSYGKTKRVTKSTLKSFEVLFLAVCVHEIAHFYMDYSRHSGKQEPMPIIVNESCCKLIEESFANVFAWSQFEDRAERRIVESFMDTQPVEYSMYRYWIKKKKTKKCLPFLISSWLNRVDPFVDEFAFEYYDEIFDSNLMSTENYTELRCKKLDFEFEKNRGWNSFIKSRSVDANFWESVGRSMLFQLKKPNKNYL